MAPIRRYLRITKYSVLECRIYLDNPALAQSWLLNPRHPILPRVIEAVRPFVLPKLREERERSRKKSTKKRGIKDTVTEGACFPPSPPSHSLRVLETRHPKKSDLLAVYFWCPERQETPVRGQVPWKCLGYEARLTH